MENVNYMDNITSLWTLSFCSLMKRRISGTFGYYFKELCFMGMQGLFGYCFNRIQKPLEYSILLSYLIKFRYQVVKEFLRDQRILAKLFWVASILPIIFSILWFLVIPRLSQMGKHANPTFLMAIFVTFTVTKSGVHCTLLASVDAVFVLILIENMY